MNNNLPIIVSLNPQERILPFVLLALGAGLQNTVVVPITTKTKYVIEIITVFSDDAINNVLVYWLISDSNTGSTSAIPAGDNLLAEWISPAFIVGHADTIRLSCNTLIDSSMKSIKMHVVNNNAYAIDIEGFVRLRMVD